MAELDQDRDQKTEEATPRKREQAREHGQVAFSQDFVASAMLLAAGAALLLGGGSLLGALGGLVASSASGLASIGSAELEPPAAALLVSASIGSVAWPALAIVAPVAAIGWLCAYGQIGLRVAPGAVSWNVDRLNPVRNAGRLFSLRSLQRLAASSFNLALVGAAVLAMAWHDAPRLASLALSEPGPALLAGGGVILRALGAGVAAALVVALADLGFQKWQLSRDLRMTKQEVRDEHRATEGDPHVRARVRQIQREMARRRMMSDVPKATVVVTNPTHFAVALRYERDAEGRFPGGAPVVVAKGVDQVARRIREVANAAGVVLYEDVQLARALFARCEIGQEVPETLWSTVATIIEYVYRLRGAARAA
jgi:flagellar biosynthetic protein FlhB